MRQEFTQSPQLDTEATLLRALKEKRDLRNTFLQAVNICKHWSILCISHQLLHFPFRTGELHSPLTASSSGDTEGPQLRRSLHFPLVPCDIFSLKPGEK